ncbi:class I SAM-dependent methyltransferase [Marivivens marinus]|uniref:class I SAM-dependent methyltransferase n=1 Tax=Marivivens marinus TaxID=3110173 RepID=UPI003B8491EC
MSFDYDRLYRDAPDALGPPSKPFVDFFKRVAGRRLTVLDLGCGQGRDALFIARMGHEVLGVDIAPHGIAALNEVAEAEGIPARGVVADIVDFQPEAMFDVLLLDRTLHMLAEGPRLSVLARLLDHVEPGGWVLISDEAPNMPGIRQVIAGHGAGWRTEYEKAGWLFLQRDAD